MYIVDSGNRKAGSVQLINFVSAEIYSNGPVKAFKGLVLKISKATIAKSGRIPPVAFILVTFAVRVP